MNKDFLVKLARDALSEFLKGKDPLLDPEFYGNSDLRKGIYVTLKRGDRLRGRAGTVVARTDNIRAETVYNTIRAARVDYFDEPVTSSELKSLTFLVDIISDITFVDELENIDYEHDGIIITDGWRKSITFPDDKNYENVEDYIIKNSLRAGIDLSKPVHISKFNIEHHE